MEQYARTKLWLDKSFSIYDINLKEKSKRNLKDISIKLIFSAMGMIQTSPKSVWDTAKLCLQKFIGI